MNYVQKFKNNTFAFAHAQAKNFYNQQRQEQIKFICLSIIILLIVAIIYYVHSKLTYIKLIVNYLKSL